MVVEETTIYDGSICFGCDFCEYENTVGNYRRCSKYNIEYPDATAYYESVCPDILATAKKVPIHPMRGFISSQEVVEDLMRHLKESETGENKGSFFVFGADFGSQPDKTGYMPLPTPPESTD